MKILKNKVASKIPINKNEDKENIQNLKLKYQKERPEPSMT